MFTLQQIIEATYEGLQQVYEKRPEERDNDLANRVLALAWLAYVEDRANQMACGRSAYQLALALGAVGKYQESFHFFEQAVAAEPNNADYHGDYAAALLRMNNLHTAWEKIRKAQALDPSNGQFDYIWGKIMEQDGDVLMGKDKVKGYQSYEHAKRGYLQAKEKLERIAEPKAEESRFLEFTKESIRRINARGYKPGVDRGMWI